MNTLAEAYENKRKERIEEFHFLVNELGVQKAKEIILKTTCLKAVIEYVNNYNDKN